MARTGEQIGNYELQESIGAGGFAQVFVARHRTFGDDCAVKVLHPQYVTNEKVRARFTREAKLQRTRTRRGR